MNYLAYWGYATSAATAIVAAPLLKRSLMQREEKENLHDRTVSGDGCVFLDLCSPDLVFGCLYLQNQRILSLVIYDSMLTDITSEERMDEVSAQDMPGVYRKLCSFICSLLLVLFYDKVGISMQTAMGISFFW
ncbi:MAG: hypothetical protein ACLTMH_09745 [Faecalimonas umbilicata]|uniref:hypothetical protein n=1 Tax=Faecalimonas umbilicata TaxID=1912855 RepID=UPI00399571AA